MQIVQALTLLVPDVQYGNGTANATTIAPTTLPPPTPVPPVNTTAAPNASQVVNCDSAQLPVTIRQRFLDQHNLRRGSLARGQSEANGNGGLAPPAANMYRMEIFLYFLKANELHWIAQGSNGCGVRIRDKGLPKAILLHTIL
ncbi:hypothetical protein TELCIR_22192 [Teladorsagia circumcincta]|uniref:SCP domain-containing protein n=1 Tax=Teladorsagia circumcincta TaxID=45464 RepID=A0A2G9TEL1_TELCI|nr:hypothetical protein TELCIR_22192 [Teladorsagia circumcincta]